MTVGDASLGALYQAVNAYARRVQAAGPNTVGFFYYSGHGASDGSANYLIRIDAMTRRRASSESIAASHGDHTQLKAEAGNATHFVVFDACRNTLKLTQPGSRAIVQSKGHGMLIAPG